MALSRFKRVREKTRTCWDSVIEALLPVGLLRTLLRRGLLQLLLRKLWQERGLGRRGGGGLDDGGLHSLMMLDGAGAVGWWEGVGE